MVEVSARRSQTREKLADAATRVFAEKGVVGASVEEICEQAGFTRGAFYSNFESKDDLCLAVLDRQAAKHLEAAKAAVTTLPGRATVTRDELVQGALEVFLRAQPDDRTSVLALAELQLYAIRTESMRSSYQAFKATITAMFANLIVEGLQGHGYQLVVPPEEALEVLHGVFEQSALEGLLQHRGPDAVQRAALMGRVLTAMLVKD